MTEIKRQLSALRVQVGTLRVIAADVGGKPPNGASPALEPPEGARRKGNLWVVPLLFGVVVGLGHSLRRFIWQHRVPIAAVTAGVAAAVGLVLYLGAAFPLPEGSQAGPPTPPPTVAAPPAPAPPHHPAVVRALRRSRSSSAPALNIVDHAPPPGASTTPAGAQAPASVPAPSAAPPPVEAVATPSPTPTPASSGLCLRVVVDPVFGIEACVLGRS
ncbi:hypothetical protein [Streptomyces mirabilis]|uniref:hypothetical protein n=1 Tax=Streptomyces mirabilis TaxID=68239 RepID=UPI0036A60584